MSERSLARTVWPILRRLLITLPVLWIVVSLVFLLIHLVPGDPIAQMMGEGASPADLSAIRHQYGFDLPLRQQYLHYWTGLLHGDWGRSVRMSDSVWHLVASRYPYTITLSLIAFLISLCIAIPLGVKAAVSRNQWQDRTIGLVSLFGLSFPNFALGPLFIIVFSIWLGWLPVSTAGTGPILGGDFWRHIILPAATLGIALAATLTRIVRTAMLEELNAEHIRTARAKGLPERTVIYKHALRNAMVPVLTVVGLQFGSLLAGAIVTETIFSWPGVGRLTISAISNRDYALVQGCTLAIGVTYLAANLLTDLLYAAVNPRIRS